VTRVVLDAAGGTMERRDASGAMRLALADMLGRLLRLWARDAPTGTPTLRGAFVYGDDAAQGGLTAAAAAAANLLGRPYRAYDEAGRVETAGYDLDGNLLTKTRTTLAASVIAAALPGPAGNWSGAAYQADWQPAAGQTIDQHAGPLLDATPYTVDSAYDALGRATSVTAPLDADGTRKILLPAYSRSGALTAVAVDGVPYVTQILYNARGQRVLAVLGGGTMTRYVYDPQTFRLARLRSEPAAGSASPSQDYGYDYDLVGNVLALHDRTPGSGIAPTTGQLDRAFTYDPLYRLTWATGRECDVPPPTPWDDTPRCTDPTKVRAYTETYTYDLVGNLLRLAHYTAAGGFARGYTIPAAGNQVTAMVTGSTSYGYGYDARGNMTSETTSRLVEWNHAGQLATFRTQAASTSEPSVYAEYRCDQSGQRVVKFVRKQGGQLAVTVYIDDLFERTTLTGSTGSSDHDALHVLDDPARVAIIRAGAPLPGDSAPPVAYHLGDHLDSSTVVLDGDGAFVNREEYTPYGETSFGSFALKRYRYTGNERDEESGLYYFGARYYSPWLARWTSADPLPKPARSSYRYAADNPLRMTDPSGAQEVTPPLASTPPPIPSVTATLGEGAGGSLGVGSAGGAEALSTFQAAVPGFGTTTATVVAPAAAGAPEAAAAAPALGVGGGVLLPAAAGVLAGGLIVGGAYLGYKISQWIKADQMQPDPPSAGLPGPVDPIPVALPGTIGAPVSAPGVPGGRPEILPGGTPDPAPQSAPGIGGPAMTATPDLPAYGGKKTSGVLERAEKTEVDLQSGRDGPALDLPKPRPGMNGRIVTHVEAHATAVMRIDGLDDATLYINRMPCTAANGCKAMLTRMVPTGATLTIIVMPKGSAGPTKKTIIVTVKP
jgi:RHS repeat-associated protein